MSTFDDMVNFIKSTAPARKFIVPCLEGPPGIGKTAAGKEAAAELKEEGRATGRVVTIIASQILPNEVSGITMPVVESKAMEIFDHYRLSSLKDGDMLFFDELLEADELVLKACLTLIESREMMSGRKLPDIHIVAATNPSIRPNMLKENIRQRFVWRKFDIDKEGCGRYIEKTCGIKLDRDILNMLDVTGDEYNILTPRSLTKMAQWIASTSDEIELTNVAAQINCIWHSSLGTQLKKAYLKKANSPTAQVRTAIKDALSIADVHDVKVDGKDIDEILEDDEAFESSSITEVMAVLQALPDWEAIEQNLSQVAMKEEEDDVVSF